MVQLYVSLFLIHWMYPTLSMNRTSADKNLVSSVLGIIYDLLP
jgi:hypothetical protein